jgi:FkbM family methyltransferase
MSYIDFLDVIKKDKVQVVFEVGSRDLVDAIKLLNYYDCNVYAFECNPDCLVQCKKQLETVPDASKLFLIDKAVSLENGPVTFYPFDLSKYDNMGASSMLKIDFSVRTKDDPEYNRENPQKEITVNGIRLDTFMNEKNISAIDLLCIDLQGYELNAIKSLGDSIKNVKYIITECSIQSTYTNGATFKELYDYLTKNNFLYVCSNKFGYKFPDFTLKGYSEFDALFINRNMCDTLDEDIASLVISRD